MGTVVVGNPSKTLTVLERMVVESISGNSKSILQLERDTGIHQSILRKVVKELIDKRCIEESDCTYQFCKTQNFFFSERYDKDESQKQESKELLNSLLGLHFKKNSQSSPFVRLQKIWMGPKELKLFQAHLYNLENFLLSIKKDQKKDQELKAIKDYQVIFWGMGSYAHIIDEVINSV